MKIAIYSFIILLLVACQTASDAEKETSNFITKFENSKGTETATYQETIQFYSNLAKHYPEINMSSIGMTDSGKPLHIATYNPDAHFNFSEIRTKKRIILINNGIHAGESDGIDATMLLFRDLANGTITTPENTILVTIPIYNIGGSLNRNSTTRTNQNGPKDYGFRGNARNYDLNRDFIKCDSKNAKTFTEIFHLVQPDIFIDNHVSNGADYQYTLTHLFTQHNKLGGDLGRFLHETIMPELENDLSKKNWDITPYVNVYNRTPDNGFSQFVDYPRYSTGYTTLFNTLGMMVETHMLKPYKQRVEGTYELLKNMLSITEKHGSEIASLRQQANATILNSKTYPLGWAIDSSKTAVLNFKGYEGHQITSDITGGKRLKYDRSKPFTKQVTYYNYFKPTTQVTIPKHYIIPQGWHEVIALLKANNIILKSISKDSLLTVESYKIEDYKTKKAPYEGHYLHYNTKVKQETKHITFKAGDFIINTNQNGLRYLLETLEPQAPDSFFNWNYFDTILQQKEGFSAYVWEDKAKQLLEDNPELKLEFENKKKTDASFSNNAYAQLDWLHKHSEHYEKAHLQYPIYRVM